MLSRAAAPPSDASCWAPSYAGSANPRESPARKPATAFVPRNPRSAGWSSGGSVSRNATSLTCSPCTGWTTRGNAMRLCGSRARPTRPAGGISTPMWFQTYVGLEEAASVLRVYEVQFVPGLLQTASYARAVMTRGWPAAPEEEIERRVSMRITRQELLSKPGGPRLWAVVDEAALRRPVGSAEVFRSQLEHLIEV